MEKQAQVMWEKHLFQLTDALHEKNQVKKQKAGVEGQEKTFLNIEQLSNYTARLLSSNDIRTSSLKTQSQMEKQAQVVWETILPLGVELKVISSIFLYFTNFLLHAETILQ